MCCAPDNHNHIGIFYIDTKDLSMKKSSIKISSGFDKHVEIPKHDLTDKMTVNGYVRNTWKRKKYKAVRYPPSYLLQIIVHYYQNEILYLFKQDSLAKCKAIEVLNIDDIVS